MPDEPTSIDPTARTGTSGPEWPKPGDHAYPHPLRAKGSLIKAFASACFSLLVAGFAVLAVRPPRNPSWFTYLSVQLVAAVAAVLGSAMLWKSYRLWRRREVALELTARGLAWPGAFEKVIPWSEVVDVVHRRAFALNRRGMAGVHVKIRDLERFKPKWAKKIWGMDVSQVTLERLPLSGMLDVDPKTLFQAIQAHRAHFGRGGRPAGS